MRKLMMAAAMAGLGTLTGSPADALSCTVDPFADVPSNDASCDSIEWLKNRQVTLGCGGSFYCPTSNVTRAQMALFMRRLADAVVQVPSYGQGSIANMTLTTLARDNVVCQAPVALVGWPRAIIFHGQASFRFATGQGNVAIDLMYTDDGNTNNWKSVTGGIQHAGAATAAAYNTLASSAVLLVPAGTPIRLGIGLRSVDGDVALANINCTRVGEIQSRTGTGTPFDETP